jgi:hypothetical protein
MRQPGKGRTDAIFSTYDVARGDAYASRWNNCRDLDGARFGKRGVHQRIAPCLSVGNNATRFLNSIANNPFSFLFPCLRLSQPYTDTLCGTEGEPEDGLLSFNEQKGLLFNHRQSACNRHAFLSALEHTPSLPPNGRSKIYAAIRFYGSVTAQTGQVDGTFSLRLSLRTQRLNVRVVPLTARKRST